MDEPDNNARSTSETDLLFTRILLRDVTSHHPYR